MIISLPNPYLGAREMLRRMNVKILNYSEKVADISSSALKIIIDDEIKENKKKAISHP